MRKIIILGTAAAAAIFAHYSQGAQNFQGNGFQANTVMPMHSDWAPSPPWGEGWGEGRGRAAILCKNPPRLRLGGIVFTPE